MAENRIALVTGANKGIGLEISRKLAQAGVHVLIGSRDKARGDEAAAVLARDGLTAKAVLLDLDRPETIADTAEAIAADYGRLDILVNNAGITKDGLILAMKEESFDAVLDINLKGAFNMIKHCTPGFLKKKSGKIINISSVSGLMGNAGQANYSAAKAGLIGLTKSVARELASRNVCCNAVAPGFIETEMTKAIDENHPLMKDIPLGRMGIPEEVAELVAFLSGDCANYITGEVIRIDGGLAM